MVLNGILFGVMTPKMIYDLRVSWTVYKWEVMHCMHFLSWTEKPAKTGTCARDRHALQQLALNVHAKHSDLT